MKIDHGNSSFYYRIVFNCVQVFIFVYLNLSYKDHDRIPDRRY